MEEELPRNGEYQSKKIYLWRQKKKWLGKAMVESVAWYGCEVWLLKREEQRKLVALEWII